MRVFILSAILGFSCLAASTALATTAKDLPGYSRLTVSAAFEDYLAKNTATAAQLKQKPELSRLIMSRATLQQQLISGQTTLADLEKQLTPNTDTQATEKPADTSTAQSLLQRAIGALSSDKARARAAAQIDTDLANAANNGNNAAANEIDDITALLAYIQENPDQLEDILSNPDQLARLEEAGIDIDALRQSTTPVTGGEMPPLQSSSGGVDPNTGTPVVSPEFPQASLAPESIDINAIPQGDQLALDANGWPKYLKVPASCPPPRAGVAYEHDHKGYMSAIYSRGVPGSGIAANGAVAPGSGFGPTPGGAMGLIIESVWIRGQTTFYLPGNGSKEFALPFNADNIGGIGAEGNFYTSAGAFEAAVSYCPGSFDNVTPAGYQPLSARCVASANAFHAVVEPYHEGRARANYAGEDITPCFVEPGKRYFVNIRPHSEHCLNKYETCGSGFSASIGHMHAHSKYPPYAGPCLENGPYPQNYRNRLCGESQLYRLGNTTIGFGSGTQPMDPGLLNCQTEGHDEYWNCYDPHDLLPSQTYARTCSADGTRMVWTQGYRKPASSRYICESKSVSRSMGQTYVSDHTAHEFDKTTGGDGSGRDFVCAAHREGQFREIAAGKPAVSGNPQAYSFSRIQQCQFNAQTQRYDWTTIEQSRGQQWRIETSHRVKSLPVAPNHTGCKIGDVVHTLGTRLINDCGSIFGKAVYECKAAGEARNSSETMLNSFQLIEGSRGYGELRDNCTTTVETP